MKFIKLMNKIFLVIVIIYKKSLDLFVNRIKIAQFHLCTYLINYTFHSPTMHIRPTCTQRYSFFLLWYPKRTPYNPNTRVAVAKGGNKQSGCGKKNRIA